MDTRHESQVWHSYVVASSQGGLDILAGQLYTFRAAKFEGHVEDALTLTCLDLPWRLTRSALACPSTGCPPHVEWQEKLLTCMRRSLKVAIPPWPCEALPYDQTGYSALE